MSRTNYGTLSDLKMFERLNRDLDTEKNMRLRSSGFSKQRNIARPYNQPPVVVEEVIQPPAPVSYDEKIAKLRGQGFSRGREPQRAKMPLPAYSTLPARDNSVYNMPTSADNLGGYKIMRDSVMPVRQLVVGAGLGGLALYEHYKRNQGMPERPRNPVEIGDIEDIPQRFSENEDGVLL